MKLELVNQVVVILLYEVLSEDILDIVMVVHEEFFLVVERYEAK